MLVPSEVSQFSKEPMTVGKFVIISLLRWAVLVWQLKKKAQRYSVSPCDSGFVGLFHDTKKHPWKHKKKWTLFRNSRMTILLLCNSTKSNAQSTAAKVLFNLSPPYSIILKPMLTIALLTHTFKVSRLLIFYPHISSSRDQNQTSFVVLSRLGPFYLNNRKLSHKISSSYMHKIGQSGKMMRCIMLF